MTCPSDPVKPCVACGNETTMRLQFLGAVEPWTVVICRPCMQREQIRRLRNLYGSYVWDVSYGFDPPRYSAPGTI